MATEKKYKSIGNNEYSEDINGACVGLEWNDLSGNTFKCIFAAFETFNMAQRLAVPLFHTFIKPAGLDEWIWKESKRASVDDNEYRYITQDAKFGTIEANPFDITPATETEPEIKTLKAGLITEADFFIGAVFKGSFGAFPLDAVLTNTICELYGLTIV